MAFLNNWLINLNYINLFSLPRLINEWKNFWGSRRLTQRTDTYMVETCLKNLFKEDVSKRGEIFTHIHAN